jgi:4,5-dihydroxyphthalate decarboxylase
VDLTQLGWLLPAPGRFPLHGGVESRVTIASGERKSPVQRLLDGEVDGSTGDITDAASWAALESSDRVRRLFPDYQALNRRLWDEHRIFTPTHVMVIGGRLNREQPDLARRILDGFARSKELALTDALGDGTSYSMLIGAREAMRDQLQSWGDVYPFGLEANRNTIDWFLDFNQEQGITRNRLSYEQVFAASTLDT